MTLHNALLHEDRAFLWCDTAFYDMDTGELVGFDAKAFACQVPPFAGILSSLRGNPHSIANAIGEARCHDVRSLLKATEAALRNFEVAGGLATILLGVWDEIEERARLFHARTCDGLPGDEEPAFLPFEIGSCINTGNDLPICADLAAKGLNPRRMRQIIDEQLKHPFELALPNANGVSVKGQYGGNVLEIVVSRSGVESSILRPVERSMAA